MGNSTPGGIASSNSETVASSRDPRKDREAKEEKEAEGRGENELLAKVCGNEPLKKSLEKPLLIQDSLNRIHAILLLQLLANRILRN